MVSEPLALDASATAQRGRERASPIPDVRAVLVCDDGALVGVVTRKTLVREVVAAGRDPATTLLGDDRRAADLHARRRRGSRRRVPRARGARPRARARSSRTAGSSASSRARSCSAGSPRTSRRPTRTPPSSRCRRRAARRPRPARAARPRRARCRAGGRARSLERRRGRSARSTSRTIVAPATITGARPGSSAGRRRRSSSGSDASRASCSSTACEREHVPVHALAVVLLEPEVERRERRHRARDADGRATARSPGSSGRTYSAIASTSSPKQLRQPHRADVEADGALARDQLGRAAADVEHERAVGDVADAAQRQRRLLLAAEQPRREPVAPLDLAEERLAVLGVAHRARRDGEHALGAERLEPRGGSP